MGPTASRLYRSFTRPVDAVPVDLFRIFVGMIAFAYFLRTLLEAEDFSGPGGLIDHEFSQRIFWFTRMGLFNSGMSLAAFHLVFFIACLCSLAVILGYRVKLFVPVLYLIGLSAYRWNFLVMYVDDAIVHLMLFWLWVLPVGSTLGIREWLAGPGAAWRRWKTAKVPGVAVRCFLGNLALIYLVAGLWKWTSPMWRDGSALYSVLKLGISRAPEFWNAGQAPVLVILNYAALVFEPLFPLIFFLPSRHRIKYALLAALVIFHVFIIATLRIPFANIACLGAGLIICGEELMIFLRKDAPKTEPVFPLAAMGYSGAVAAIFVLMLTLTVVSSASLPRWRTPYRDRSASSITQDASAPIMGLGRLQKPLYSALWGVGIAQDYQLFNWIDERNFAFRYEAFGIDDGENAVPIDLKALFPDSVRTVAIQAYLNDLTWAAVPSAQLSELKRILWTRLAARYCNRNPSESTVSLYSSVQRITSTSHSLSYPRGNVVLRFACSDNKPVLQIF